MPPTPPRKPRALAVWELGTGLGHLSCLRLPIEVALDSGYEVFLAARELDHVAEVLGDLPLSLLQAPFKPSSEAADQSQFLSYVHLLHHQCFGAAPELAARLTAWRGVFDLVAPDLVFFEHSPTALVAAHGYGFKKVLVGTGFTVPTVDPSGAAPLGVFPTTPLSPSHIAHLRQDEATVLATLATALHSLGSPGLNSLHRVYAQADAVILGTVPALDVFGPRPGLHYLGVEPLCVKAQPPWPASTGARVFGYLQTFPGLPQFLSDLQAAGVCAVLFVRHLPHELRRKFAGNHLCFVDELIDLQQVAAQASWVVHHGNHNTMAGFAAAGVPQLLLPRHQEQLFGALRLVASGCAALAFQDQPAYAAAIATLQGTPALRKNAEVLAQSFPSYDRQANYNYVRGICDTLHTYSRY